MKPSERIKEILTSLWPSDGRVHGPFEYYFNAIINYLDEQSADRENKKQWDVCPDPNGTYSARPTPKPYTEIYGQNGVDIFWCGHSNYNSVDSMNHCGKYHVFDLAAPTKLVMESAHKKTIKRSDKSMFIYELCQVYQKVRVVEYDLV